MIKLPKPLKVVYISSYPPRKCGIATYTKDLATGINSLHPDCFAEIIAMDDSISEKLDYPWEVSKRVRQDEWSDYENVITYLNSSVIDVVCIQHEFGIFGADSGVKVVKFIEAINKPVVVTFHSVLARPTEAQKAIIQAISAVAKKVVVMLESSRDVLVDVYGVNRSKVVAIHHGAPDFAFESSDTGKQRLKLADRIVMSSINLLGRGRGIEHAIAALPDVVKKYPNFLYLIIGQTHPSVLAHEGEAYRNELEALVKKLGLKKNVRFINEYVSLDDLILYVRASDLYITPYENMETASSGSLAYAIAAGKLCISTPFKYALEMFAGARGRFIPNKDPQAIAKTILTILREPKAADRMRARCYQEGRKMTWTRVGYRYLEEFRTAAASDQTVTIDLPSLGYIKKMTDKIGILEHSLFDSKNHDEGYAVDDNARALIAAVRLKNWKLASVYLKFLTRALDGDGMVCDLNYLGQRHGKSGYGDWYGRAIWALSVATVSSHRPTQKQASRLLSQLFSGLNKITDIRAAAYCLIGLGELKLKESTIDPSQLDQSVTRLTQFILSHFKKLRRSDWVWVEDSITYDCPRVAQALILVGRVFGRPEVLQTGIEMLNFLLDATYDDRLNHFRFVGNIGWYPKGKTKAEFDEQPIEAGAIVMACVEAYRATQLSYYKTMAEKGLLWFHGDNIHRVSLVRPSVGSVYDGLTYREVNLNQGAESALEYVLATVEYATISPKHDRAKAAKRPSATS